MKSISQIHRLGGKVVNAKDKLEPRIRLTKLEAALLVELLTQRFSLLVAAEDEWARTHKLNAIKFLRSKIDGLGLLADKDMLD